jgi:hypothetical protein
VTHTMVTFQLHRKGVVLVALGALLLGILLFMAGCIAGMRFGEQQTAGPSHLVDEAQPSSTPDRDRDDAKTETRASPDPSSPADPGSL